MRLRQIGSLALMVTLAGCGVATTAHPTVKNGGARAQSESRFFPADPKAVWQYEVSATPSDDPYVDPLKGVETVTVDSIRRQGDSTVLSLRAIDDYTNEYRFPVLTESPDGVELKGVTYFGTAASGVDDLTIGFLKFPLAPGARWDDGQWIGKAVAKETVKVPAGTYEAWKIDVIGTFDHAYTAVGKYWVAPGKGIVKSELGIPGWDIKSVLIPAGRAPLKPTKRLFK
jgi:hypothetical protein